MPSISMSTDLNKIRKSKNSVYGKWKCKVLMSTKRYSRAETCRSWHNGSRFSHRNHLVSLEIFQRWRLVMPYDVNIGSGTKPSKRIIIFHDDVIKWKHFPRYWPFVRGIHRSPVNSPHVGQWRGALIFSLICARINGWVNNREAGDLRRHRAHNDVIVMYYLSRLQFVKAVAVTPLFKNSVKNTPVWKRFE